MTITNISTTITPNKTSPLSLKVSHTSMYFKHDKKSPLNNLYQLSIFSCLYPQSVAPLFPARHIPLAGLGFANRIFFRRIGKASNLWEDIIFQSIIYFEKKGQGVAFKVLIWGATLFLKRSYLGWSAILDYLCLKNFVIVHKNLAQK